MDISTLKTKIQSKQIPSYLIFAGPEWQVQQIYINQIIKVVGKRKLYIDSVADIYSQLKNKSFVSSSYVYIVRDDKDLLTNEKLQQNIKSGILGDNILIHLITAIDKRTKFYKQYQSDICIFEPLSNQLLQKYIKREVDLSQDNINYLIEICESDYGRILLEIDKIRRYALFKYPEVGHEEENGDYNRAIEDLVKDGTIYQPPYDAIFDLVDAILDRKVNKTFDLLDQSYTVGEATMVMLSVLYNNAKAVLQVQSYEGDNLSKATGLTGWQIKNARAHIHKYSDNELIRLLQLIHKVEKGIKTGTIEDEFAMQYLLIKSL